MISGVLKSRAEFPKRTITCDVCQEANFTAPAEKDRAGEGQLRSKAMTKGWTFVKRVDRCPACEAERKETNVVNMQTIKGASEKPLREPSRAQKREIMLLLEEVYDAEAGRYNGTESDKTVADTLGDGILHGWVAQIREEFFGPDGNQEADAMNQEIDDLRKHMAQCAQKAHDQITLAQRELRQLNDFRDRLEKLQERLNKLSKAS